jgi:hypothetical protein
MTEKNNYDSKDRVRQLHMLRAGPLKFAAYQVRDPVTNEWSKIQFHMTYDNTVMAVMEENSAKLFADMVGKVLAIQKPEDEWTKLPTYAAVEADRRAVAERRQSNDAETPSGWPDHVA